MLLPVRQCPSGPSDSARTAEAIRSAATPIAARWTARLLITGKPGVRVRERETKTNQEGVATFANLPAPGDYHAWVAAPAMDAARPTVDFAVVPPAGEFERVEMEAASLRRAAQRTRGRFYTIDGSREVINPLNMSGVKLEAEGRLDTATGILTAEEIEFRETRVRIEGPVQPGDVDTDLDTLVILGITVSGIAFGEIRLLTGSVWPAVIMHLATNTLGLAAAYMLSQMGPLS